MSNPQLHHRRSIRLPGYDYSQPGAYFVTVVTQGRACLFGEIADGQIRLDACGEIVRECWNTIPRQFPGVELDAFVAMPNHIHGIVIIGDRGRGEAFGDAPSAFMGFAPNASPLRIAPHGTRPGSLASVVQNLKSVSTRRINQRRRTPGAPVWQRNYYERVVRGEAELNRIREYIADNAQRWAEDEENPSRSPRAASCAADARIPAPPECIRGFWPGTSTAE